MADRDNDMQEQMQKLENEDPIQLEDQIERLTEALDYIRKGIRKLVQLDSTEPRVMIVKRGLLRVVAPYERLLEEKKIALSRVQPTEDLPRSRRNGK